MPVAPPVATVPPVPRLIPAHEQVADHYRDEIRKGVYKAGDQFPTIRDIAKAWGGISPTTVQAAITMLKEEGWIENRPRRGATVLGIPDNQK